jgi:hypothetical protein
LSIICKFMVSIYRLWCPRPDMYRILPRFHHWTT